MNNELLPDFNSRTPQYDGRGNLIVPSVPVDSEGSGVNPTSLKVDGLLPQQRINAGMLPHNTDKSHPYHDRGKPVFDHD